MKTSNVDTATTAAPASPDTSAAPSEKTIAATPMKTLNETFVMANDASFAPATLDKANRTVDVVWYGGATVPRRDPYTGDAYMFRLDMNGCRMERLNAGAPFFDNHMTGTGWNSAPGMDGSKAQLATVQKAWADNGKGMATLKFRDEGEDENADNMFSGIASGHFRNLSFGTWIYDKKLESSTTDAAGNKMDTYVATDWEPYEVSQANVPADYTTTFLSAENVDKTTPPVIQGDPLHAAPLNFAGIIPQGNITFVQMGDRMSLTIPANSTTSLADVTTFLAAQKSAPEQTRATAHTKEPGMETTTQATGDPARNNNDAVAKEAAQLAVQQERDRVTAIRAMLSPFKFEATYVDQFIDKGVAVEEARKDAMAKLAAEADKNVTRVENASITRDGKETRLACMEQALLKRHNFSAFSKLPAEEQRRCEDMARQYTGVSLFEMAREVAELNGVKVRGMNRNDVAGAALIPNHGHVQRFSMGGAETTSDFPSILANVANKTLRQAYEAMPQTFMPFSKQATASDFKPINRVQLNDLPSLPLLNEKGEYKRVNLTDQNATYSLGTYGGVVAITRKAIVNDDLSAFTRTSAQLGQAAARTQSDVVWNLITANGNMADGYAVFEAAHHKNYLTGVASSLDPTVNTGTSAVLQALAAGRKALRVQKGPSGTPLNLVPKFLVAPAALETYALQANYPMQLAASQVSGVTPEWVLSLTTIIEPRLDDYSAAAWYFIADPAMIDTVEYCFLEGQEGVYYEMRQGFDVDGLEIKARLDFGAQVIDFRGVQKNKGAA